jgi:ATP-dependent 26S proteasome regulatory subunit
MNNLLNQLDGNELKGVNCTFIFTTNNHDKIHPAMRRPGRIDQVVHFDYCTVEQISKIFEVYAEGMEGAADVDYKKAAEGCPEKLQGAVVAEISRRAVGYAKNFYESVISTDRFLDAIASMDHHIKFMREDQKKDHTAEHLLGHLMYKSMKKAFPMMGNDRADWRDSPYEGLDN